MSDGEPRPRPGDVIVDPSGGRNVILNVRPAKLLLQDGAGVIFVLGRYRLSKGWRLVASRKPREGL